MIFEVGQRFQALPPHSEVIEVRLIDKWDISHAVMQTSMEFLEQERRDPSGGCKFYMVAVSSNGNLHIHPEPKEKITLIVRYTPPAKEC